MSLTQSNKFLSRIKRFTYILPFRLLKLQRPKWRRLLSKIRRSQVQRKWFLRVYSHKPLFSFKKITKLNPKIQHSPGFKGSSGIHSRAVASELRRRGRLGLPRIKSKIWTSKPDHSGVRNPDGSITYAKGFIRPAVLNDEGQRILAASKARRKQRRKNEKARFHVTRRRKSRKRRKIPYNKFFPTVIGLRRAKTKFSYKWSLWLKRELFLFFNNELTLKHYKKILNKMSLLTRKAVMLELFIRPFFQLNILLWKLGLFKTVVVLNQFFIDKLILVNNTVVHGGLLLKKGDFVALAGCNFNLLPARKKFLKTRRVFSRFSAYQLKTTQNLFSTSMGKITFLWSIVEIDYFTNTFILLIDYKDCTKGMLPFLLRADLLNIFLFLKYIKNK